MAASWVGLTQRSMAATGLRLVDRIGARSVDLTGPRYLPEAEATDVHLVIEMRMSTSNRYEKRALTLRLSGRDSSVRGKLCFGAFRDMYNGFRGNDVVDNFSHVFSHVVSSFAFAGEGWCR